MTSTDELAYPVEVEFDHDGVPADFLDAPAGGGLDRWAPLLPPLVAAGLGEGGTPLIDLGDGLFVKDESRNPTWSHKDRLNRCTVSAAKGTGAAGVVVASSGNHGASAAAYAARAGLGCVVLLNAGGPRHVESFVGAYGAAVVAVPKPARWPIMRRIVDELGYHPVSNLTVTHTGHAFGPEGYKSIAYEIVADLGLPGAVFVPTGYGELLFGVWKGFDELRRIGVTTGVPRLYSCEPAAGGPLAAAIASDLPATSVDVGPTAAYAISCAVGGYRARLALTSADGRALLLTDAELAAARRQLAGAGIWSELSAAAGLAGYRQVRERGETVPGPVVCVSTSSGFKDLDVGTRPAEPVHADWAGVREHLRRSDLPGC